MVRIQSVKLQHVCMKMREPFETSFGVEEDRDAIIVTVVTAKGNFGYGECVASPVPLYSEETNGTAWHMLQDFFIPALQHLEFHSVQDLHRIREILYPYKGNKMAKAAIEMAIWDAFSNETEQPLVKLLGGTKAEIPVGISIGIQPSIHALLDKVRGYLEQGFQRIKLKVRPGFDLEPLTAVREAFPDILLMADANSAYRIDDMEHLQKWDHLHLMMIEQPLSHDDIVDHARLQALLKTPVCLDESIHSVDDLRKAIDIKACQVVNLKVGRVGGFGEALLIHQLCKESGIDLWCGGMEETGIGRLHNIALTALPGFTLPGDTAPSARYFDEDIIDPPVLFSRPGVLKVEPLAGVASRVNLERLSKWTLEELVIDSKAGVV